ncbi:MAG: hypothetical protein ACRD2J_17105 [Thermoanaerobaculia bacterium]
MVLRMNLPRVCAVVLVFLLAVPSIAAAQDFYEGQLVAGKVAYAAENYVEAADAFRIAAFGFLDRPGLLLEALAHLALSRTAMGQTDAAGETIERWIEIETRFPSWRRHEMDEEVRTAFETLLKQRIPEERLLAIESLEGLVPTEEEKLAALPPRERRRRLEQLVREEANKALWPAMLAELALADRERRDALRWSTAALELDSGMTRARIVRARVLLEMRSCEEALATIAQLGGAMPRSDQTVADHFLCLVETREYDRAAEMVRSLPDEVQARRDIRAAVARIDEARVARAEAERPARREPEPRLETRATEPAETPTQALARLTSALREGQRLIATGRYPEAAIHYGEALESDPGNRQLRLALLEAATLARDFATAEAQLPLVSPLRDTEAKYLFYAAVARYEAGDLSEAQDLMARARPRLASSPYVDDYVRKILGE